MEGLDLMTNKDPYRPEHPNNLYFVADRYPRKTHYYWQLQSHDGKVIGSSNESYPEKIDAIRNAIALFGKEIWAGYHIVVDPSDHRLVLEEGVRQETEFAEKAKDAFLKKVEPQAGELPTSTMSEADLVAQEELNFLTGVLRREVDKVVKNS